MNASEGKNQSGGKREGGGKEARAGPRRPPVPAAARQVQHRGQPPPLSASAPRARAQPGRHRGRVAAFSAKPACGGERGGGRAQSRERGACPPSPRLVRTRPRSQGPSCGIAAAAFHLVSRGTSLLSTRCWGPRSRHGESRVGLGFVSPSLPQAPAARDLSRNNAQPSLQSKWGARGTMSSASPVRIRSCGHAGTPRPAELRPKATSITSRGRKSETQKDSQEEESVFLPMQPRQNAVNSVRFRLYLPPHEFRGVFAPFCQERRLALRSGSFTHTGWSNFFFSGPFRRIQDKRNLRTFSSA